MITRGATGIGEDYSGTNVDTIATDAFALTAGNLAVVGWRAFHGGGGVVTITSATDTAGNTYTVIPGATQDTNVHCGLAYCENTLGDASNVVSLVFDFAEMQFWSIGAVQYSGVALTSALDQSNAGSSGLGAPTSGSITAVQNDEVVIAVAEVAATGGVWTPDTGFTKFLEDSVNVLMMQDLITTSGFSGTVSAVSTSVTSAQIGVASFTAADGGGAATPGKIIFRNRDYV